MKTITVLDIRGRTPDQIAEALNAAPAEAVVKLGKRFIRAEKSPLPESVHYVQTWDETVTAIIVTFESMIPFMFFRAEKARCS